MKALALNPHDDDCVIGMGGTLIQLLDKGWEVGYVQLTDGRHGSNVMSPEETRRIRVLESRAERDFLGIDLFYSFDIEDGTLANLSREETLSEKLARIIDEYQAKVVFMPGRAEAHPDHRATSILGHEAVEKSRSNPLEVHYTVWLLPYLAYDPGPLERVLAVPIDPFFGRKIDAIKLHKSQEKEGRYSQLVECLNTYLSLAYFGYAEKSCNRIEVLAIHKINERYSDLVSNLKEVKDVTKVFHGRMQRQIEA